MEYAEGGELFDYIIKKDHLSENETRHIFHQIIDAIDYMHQMGICHRDLKPENILFDASHKNIKIIDFGLSNLYYTSNNEYGDNIKNEQIDNYEENDGDGLDIDLLETPCGSPGYAPPEMVLGYSYNGLLTDIWSGGIILYAMLCGSFPFDDDSEQILYSKIVKGIFEFPSDIILSDEAKNLVKKILIVNPINRAGISEIKNDPWFKKDYKPIYGLFLPIQEIPVDNFIINEMIKNGYKKDEIIKNIKNNRHNEITTFYYLLVKKYSRNGYDIVNDLISPSFTKYILEQNNKIKNLKNYKILINLKLIFEQLKLEEAQKIVKELEKEINEEKKSLKEIEKEKEKDTEKNNINNKNVLKEKNKERKQTKEKKIKDFFNTNKIEPKNNCTLEVISPRHDSNINKYISNLSHKKEEIYYMNLNKSNIYKKKDSQLKDFKNIILDSLHKNIKFKKLKKILGKKEVYGNYINKLKLNTQTLEKSSNSKNKKDLKTSLNLKKDATINLSFPYQEKETCNTLAISTHTKREKNYINQGINSSRINTDRINYEKYFSIKPNIKTLIKKRNIPLYQKFTLNCKENKNKNRKYKPNQGYINKYIKKAKASAFNVYYLNKNNTSKNNDYTNNNIKNIGSKNVTMKNISVQKEKGNMSYRQIPKDKILLENNFSRILTISEGKSNSTSKGKVNLQINTPFNNSSRNKYFKSIKNKKIIKKNMDYFENNFNRKQHIDNKEKKNELKIKSNKSNENNNNINFSININLNVNQIKNNLKEREKTSTGEQNKHKKIINSLKGIKLDLKKINNNNNHIFNQNPLINSERIKSENIFKIKQDFIINKKYNYLNNSKCLINPKLFNAIQLNNNSYSKEEYKYKKIRDIDYKIQEQHKQKSFVDQKTNIFNNSLSKLLPFLKSMKSFKINSLKKTSPKIKKKAIISLNNNSNSIIINKVNTNFIKNQNYKYKMNPKIEQIKHNKKIYNNKMIRNITNNSYIYENSINNQNLLNQDKNNSKKSPSNCHHKMKPLNLKSIINEHRNSYVYKSHTMRGEQSKNKIITSINDELSKSGKYSKKKGDNSGLYIINKISPNKNLLNKVAIFQMPPLKIKDILMNYLPKSNININQKNSKNNYFIFHCLKGSVKIIIELLQIKGNNNIFVHMKCLSGSQKEYLIVRKQILDIINNFKNI